MTHPASQELLELVQRRADETLASRLNAHIAVCERCAAHYRALERVEGALTSMQPEKPSRGFDRAVLRRLGLREAGSLWWTFMKNFAPVLVAAAVIGSVMYFGSGPTGGGGSMTANPYVDTGKLLGIVSGALGGMSTAAGNFFHTQVSPLLSGGSGFLTLYLVFLFAAIWLLDKFLIGPIFRRWHEGGRP